MSRVEEVLRDAESLEPEDRLRLIARLWASLPPDHWAAPSTFQRAEIRRHYGGTDTEPVYDPPWDALRRILNPGPAPQQAKIYHATRRFDLATIFVAMAVYSVLLAGMSLVPDSQDEAYLDKGQAAEERIGSVDYDIWQCPSCAHRLELRYAKWLSKYDKCPQCANRTRWSAETVLQAATTSSDGLARVNEKCEFCSYRNEYTKVLPRIQQSSSSSGGGSSSSSFGGGRSGGGGASRGY